MNPISLFTKLPEVKKTSERAELIKFFVENMRNKKGKPFAARMLAIKLSHVPTKDLYYMTSLFKDIRNRKGDESAQKWFFWSLRS